MAGLAVGSPRSRMTQAVWKLKILKRDENDILKFDLEIELACDAGTSNDLERLTCSIAIVRPHVFTQSGPKADIAPSRVRKLFYKHQIVLNCRTSH